MTGGQAEGEDVGETQTATDSLRAARLVFLVALVVMAVSMRPDT